MLAKKTSKNQVTWPKAVVRQLLEVEYFEVSLPDGPSSSSRRWSLPRARA